MSSRRRGRSRTPSEIESPRDRSERDASALSSTDRARPSVPPPPVPVRFSDDVSRKSTSTSPPVLVAPSSKTVSLPSVAPHKVGATSALREANLGDSGGKPTLVPPLRTLPVPPIGPSGVLDTILGK